MSFFQLSENENMQSVYGDLVINDCASNPCLNHGTCTDIVKGYNCSCHPGYSGVMCETGNHSNIR